MKETKFLAGLATILVFIGIFCFKAVKQRKVFTKESSHPVSTSLKNSTKIILILLGGLSIMFGLVLFIQCFKRI